jgi:hypothetical protein
VGPRDGATATYHGGGNSDIILDCAKWNSGTLDSRTSFRGVENGGRIYCYVVHAVVVFKFAVLPRGLNRLQPNMYIQ